MPVESNIDKNLPKVPGEGAPPVSVVMSVFNGEDQVRDTLSSILQQTGVEIEVVVVNDGSIDATGRMLREFASEDKRIRILEQENLGLTRSLVRGCSAARGEYIARQDCGDRSLPGRIAAQYRLLEAKPDVTMVSCGACFVTEEGEVAYEKTPDRLELESGLKALTMDGVVGPAHHGSVMFRRATYEKVGGYRIEFTVGQDLDLWMRMVEHGRHDAIDEVLYEARLEKNSISFRKRDLQLAAGSQAIECAAARRAGQPEPPIKSMDNVGGIRTESLVTQKRMDSRYYYFVGSCLSRNNSRLARRYFLRALRTWPLGIKSLLRYLRTFS